MNTCRVCKGQDGSMFKYGTRHYAHGKCGIARFGAEFLDMIPAHMIPALPYFALQDAGLLDEVLGRLEQPISRYPHQTLAED